MVDLPKRKYEVWFQNSQVLMIVEAATNVEARKKLNKQISIRRLIKYD